MPVSHFSVERHALLGERAGQGDLALAESELPRDAIIRRNPFLEAHLPRKRETFLEHRAYPRLVALGDKEYLSQLGKYVSDAPLHPRRSVHRHALLVQGTRPAVLTQAGGH